MKISVFGLGKLGLPLAAVLARGGHDLHLYDSNTSLLESLSSGRHRPAEPGLVPLLDEFSARLHVEFSPEAALAATDLTFVIVPTPSRPDGSLDLGPSLQAFERIGAGIRNKPSRHHVVMVSTVMPGACEKVLIPCLERASGKKCPELLGFTYSPQFIALGSVVENLCKPDFYLIGERTGQSSELESVLGTIRLNDAAFLKMTPTEAELTKLSINTFLTTKITFANVLSRFCEALPGVDVDVVAAAVGSDSRIGKKLLKGGTPYGGPCFPRDNRALDAFAREVGVVSPLSQATHDYNASMTGFLVDKIQSQLPREGTVGILGLTYKAGSAVIDVAFGYELAQKLRDRGLKVCAFDSALPASEFPPGVMAVDSASACLRESSALVVTLPDPRFAEAASELACRQSPLIVIDLWRFFRKAPRSREVSYQPAGIGPNIEGRDDTDRSA